MATFVVCSTAAYGVKLRADTSYQLLLSLVMQYAY